MRQEEIYLHLKEIADKFEILFMEKNFRNAGVAVKSGLCKINGRTHFLMDKHKKTREKNEILSKCLMQFPVDEIYIVPGVREYLEKMK